MPLLEADGARGDGDEQKVVFERECTQTKENKEIQSLRWAEANQSYPCLSLRLLFQLNSYVRSCLNNVSNI